MIKNINKNPELKDIHKKYTEDELDHIVNQHQNRLTLMREYVKNKYHSDEEYRKKVNKRNKERYREQKLLNKNGNIKVSNEYQKKYRYKNSEKLKEYQKQYRENRKNKIKKELETKINLETIQKSNDDKWKSNGFTEIQ